MQRTPPYLFTPSIHYHSTVFHITISTVSQEITELEFGLFSSTADIIIQIQSDWIFLPYLVGRWINQATNQPLNWSLIYLSLPSPTPSQKKKNLPTQNLTYLKIMPFSDNWNGLKYYQIWLIRGIWHDYYIVIKKKKIIAPQAWMPYLPRICTVQVQPQSCTCVNDPTQKWNGPIQTHPDLALATLQFEPTYGVLLSPSSTYCTLT